MIKHVLANGSIVDSVDGMIVPPEGKCEAAYRMVAMKVKKFIQVFDTEDTSEKDLILKGVTVGTYRNDVLCKWYAAQEIQIGDFEKYICRRLQDHVGYLISSAEDVKRASLELDISEWMMGWMKEETH